MSRQLADSAHLAHRDAVVAQNVELEQMRSIIDEAIAALSASTPVVPAKVDLAALNHPASSCGLSELLPALIGAAAVYESARRAFENGAGLPDQPAGALQDELSEFRAVVDSSLAIGRRELDSLDSTR